MLRLTRHFVDNWMARVDGRVPDPRMVEALINSRHTVRPIRFQEYESADGALIRILEVRWYVPGNLIITIDRASRAAVSVYTPVNSPAGKAKERRSA
jgi:hypothetical protein